MKILERGEEGCVFGMSAREKELLFRLLSFYPLRPEGGAMLSRTGGAAMADASRWLAESRRDQRLELAAWVASRLEDGDVLRRQGGSWRLALNAADGERLLQVLNDIRVGAWMKLGEPENLDAIPSSTDAGKSSLHLLMTLAGQFEVVVLAGLQGDEGEDLPG
jgi:hypothetical protein